MRIMKVFLSFALILTLFLPSFAEANNRVAVLKEVKGTVYVKKSGGKKEFKGSNGMSLTQGDSVRTDKKSSAQIVYENGTKTTVGASSSIMITKLKTEKDAEKSTVKVWSGKIWNSVKNLSNTNDSYNVETPTAVMGVRGTHFLVETDPVTGKTTITVLEGTVGVNDNQAAGSTTKEETLVSLNETIEAKSELGEKTILNIEQLVQQVDSEMLVQVVTDLTNAAKENNADAQLKKEEFDKTKNTNLIKESVKFAQVAKAVTDTQEKLINSIKTSTKATEFERVLKETTNKTISNLEQEAKQLKEETTKATDKIIEQAKNSGVSEQEIKDKLTPASVPVNTTQTSGGGGSSGGGSTSVPAQSITASLEIGFTLGSTIVWYQPAHGNTLKYKLANTSIASPTVGSAPPADAISYTPYSDIKNVAAGQYIQLYEMDSSGKIIKFNQFKVEAEKIQYHYLFRMIMDYPFTNISKATLEFNAPVDDSAKSKSITGLISEFVIRDHTGVLKKLDNISNLSWSTSKNGLPSVTLNLDNPVTPSNTGLIAGVLLADGVVTSTSGSTVNRFPLESAYLFGTSDAKTRLMVEQIKYLAGTVEDSTKINKLYQWFNLLGGNLTNVMYENYPNYQKYIAENPIETIEDLQNAVDKANTIGVEGVMVTQGVGDFVNITIKDPDHANHSISSYRVYIDVNSVPDFNSDYMDISVSDTFDASSPVAVSKMLPSGLNPAHNNTLNFTVVPLNSNGDRLSIPRANDKTSIVWDKEALDVSGFEFKFHINPESWLGKNDGDIYTIEGIEAGDGGKVEYFVTQDGGSAPDASTTPNGRVPFANNPLGFEIQSGFNIPLIHSTPYIKNANSSDIYIRIVDSKGNESNWVQIDVDEEETDAPSGIDLITVLQKSGSPNIIVKINDDSVITEGIHHYKVFFNHSTNPIFGNPSVDKFAVIKWDKAGHDVEIDLNSLENGSITQSHNDSVKFSVIAYDKAGNASPISDESSIIWRDNIVTWNATPASFRMNSQSTVSSNDGAVVASENIEANEWIEVQMVAVYQGGTPNFSSPQYTKIYNNNPVGYEILADDVLKDSLAGDGSTFKFGPQTIDFYVRGRDAFNNYTEWIHIDSDEE